ncbi:MAG: DNA-3-methyladenine glycosylase 2 family protein [Pseudomonadota bacterium]
MDELAGRDQEIADALALVGYPEERRRGGANFETLLRIIVGQQLSVTAAATIFGRVRAALDHDLQPERLLALSDEALRSQGLSKQKIGYARGLSDALIAGELEPEALHMHSDEEVIKAVTRLKGFGRWSAEMFLIATLGRPDVWPVDDLGVRAGLQMLKQLSERPTPKQAERMGEDWRPYRSSVALLIWHYHANAPL